MRVHRSHFSAIIVVVHLCTLSVAQRCPLGRFTQLTNILILLHIHKYTLKYKKRTRVVSKLEKR